MRLLPILLAVAAIAQQPTYDLIILNGRIVDGAGAAWFRGDVAIRGGKIARIAPPNSLAKAAAKDRIDARNLIVAPGFIDIQSHSRDSLLRGDSRVISKVTQGITTEILGEGSTNAPYNDNTAKMYLDEANRKLDAQFAGPRGFRNWLAAIEKRGASTNFGSFVGATTLRVFGKGMDQGQPSAAELNAMRSALKNAMEDGAFGIASALIYAPGEYAGAAELIELSKTMAPYGGVYITHMRSEADKLLEAIDEAIEIGRKGGVPVEIYHLKAAGKRNHPKMAQAVAKIHDARSKGLDVQANMYPYTQGGTGLSACLPPWAIAGGKLFENLQNKEKRQKMREEIVADTGGWENLCVLSTPDGVLITAPEKPENAKYAGKTLAQIAQLSGKDWIEAAMDLVLSERDRVDAIFALNSEDNLRLQIRQPWIKFGTDAGGADPDTDRYLVHPRSYGTFTKILGRFVREEKVIPLEDAIRKATSAVATRLSIPDRGLVKEGFWADLVVFDPDTVIDNATFDRPHQVSTGIRDVLVNGVPVVRDAKHTGAKPGKIVRGPGFRP
ncbi:MAG: D-aminoacylase [Bryobacteraceae bacterium]|nr:D-aminoacylase [Bryobacteraceae bacterium]